MDAHRYRHLERQRRELLALTEPRLPPVEARFVRQFIHAGEFALALEHIASCLVEQTDPVGPAPLHQIASLAAAMGLENDEAVSRLLHRPAPAALRA